MARSQCGFYMRILCMLLIWKWLLHRVKLNPSVGITNTEGFDLDNDDNAWMAGVMVTTSVGKDIMP